MFEIAAHILISLGLSKYGADVILHGRDEQALDDIYDEIVKEYKNNILTMEELTRIQINLDLIKKHQVSLLDSFAP